MKHTNNMHPHLSTELGATTDAIRESQRLRYQIFAKEQGATLESEAEGLDRDHYDNYCHHLLVREQPGGEIIGSTRILTTANARDAGSFYSENEFDLTTMFPRLQGNAIEIGRTCIRRDYRNGTGIAALWQGLAHFIETHQVDYMFGCASVSMRDGGQQAAAIMQQARQKHLAPTQLQVTPRVRLLPTSAAEKVSMPPLLKAYLKLGAWVAGEPCLDPDFNVADVFILLDLNNLDTRYHHHFIQNGTRNTIHQLLKPSPSSPLPVSISTQ